MEKGICYIVGAGECDVLDFQPVPADYVIAADGGLRYLEQNKITADFIIGDFDSLRYTPNVIYLRSICGNEWHAGALFQST